MQEPEEENTFERSEAIEQDVLPHILELLPDDVKNDYHVMDLEKTRIKKKEFTNRQLRRNPDTGHSTSKELSLRRKASNSKVVRFKRKREVQAKK